MAENNSSAPLKTAELPLAVRTAPERIWLDLGVEEAEHINFADLEVTWSDDNATGRGIAYVRADTQAVAAQAAPAAVAVPDDLVELAMLNKLIELGSKAAYESAKSSSDDGPHGTAAFVRWQELRADMRALIHATYPSLATPALPATEDSSAGDLAEVPDGFGSAEHWKEKAQYWAGVAHELRGQALRGEPVDGIIQPTSQAEVQAEPVAVREDEKWRERWYGSPPMKGWSIMHGREQIAYLGPDASSDDVRALVDALNAAPQAQPADALDGPIRQLIRKHAALLAENESAYFELCYHRATGWMAWITDRPLCMPPVINPGRKVIAQGQGDTAEEACSDAMAAAQEGGNAAKEA